MAEKTASKELDAPPDAEAFSADWLTLRMAADRRSRSRVLMTELSVLLENRDAPLIVDVGCGFGANASALQRFAPPNARWRLLDNDVNLLARARAEHPRAEVVETDLADLKALRAQIEDADVVTASAFLDLGSAAWLEDFAAAIPARAHVLTALSYDGRQMRVPPHEEDRLVINAFHRHMRRDKGFGSALGPSAITHFAAQMTGQGRLVRTADSAWRLSLEAGDGPLMAALDAGVADAAEAEGRSASGWRETLRVAVVTGHLDLLAHGL